MNERLARTIRKSRFAIRLMEVATALGHKRRSAWVAKQPLHVRSALARNEKPSLQGKPPATMMPRTDKEQRRALAHAFPSARGRGRLRELAMLHATKCWRPEHSDELLAAVEAGGAL
jgi:hypothetical protein